MDLWASHRSLGEAEVLHHAAAFMRSAGKEWQEIFAGASNAEALLAEAPVLPVVSAVVAEAVDVERHFAAIDIQRVYRGYQDRAVVSDVLWDMRQQRRRAQHAVTIQRVYRGHVGRKAARGRARRVEVREQQDVGLPLA